MIIVRLRGGLGNQLFQYAAGLSLAKELNTTLKLDLYTYTKHAYRTFELDLFKMKYEIAATSEIHRHTGSNILTRYFHKKTNYKYNKNVYAQPEYAFSKSFHEQKSPAYLSGYWQSEKFFLNVEDEIKKSFVPKANPSSENQKIIDKIASENAVSVHIRRGDYQNNASYNGFFGLLPMTYFQKAIAHIKDKVELPTFYFFSDDPDWCRQEFGHLEQATFVSHNSGKDSFWDMILMSKCKHNVTANSTFSWWGAWLNANPSKIVIAPKKWFNKEYFEGKNPSYYNRFYDTKDQIPQNWIKF